MEYIKDDCKVKVINSYPILLECTEQELSDIMYFIWRNKLRSILVDDLVKKLQESGANIFGWVKSD